MRPVGSAVDWIARSPVRAFILLFLLGLSVRVFSLATESERRILPHDRWEDTAIAISLIERGQFADPYMIATGPTAHLPPLVPGVLALIWGLFGLGLLGGYAARMFSVLAFSTLYALLPWFGGKLGLGRQAGVLGGTVGAIIVLPPGNLEELAGILLALLAIAFLHRWTSPLGTFGGSLLLGAACGAAFHLQPVLLPVVLGWIIFELWWSRDQRKWSLSGAVVLGIVVVCVPWVWRNYRIFNEVYFIRSNLGLELRMGNHDGAAGAMEAMAEDDYRHPRTHPGEARMVLELGEAEYMRRAKVEAIDWIKRNPEKFVSLTISRFFQFWLGPMYQPWIALAVTGLTILALMGAWRLLPAITPPQRAAVMIPLICYPPIYYVVGYMPRYRVPLDWILLLLAGGAVWHWVNRRSGSTEK